ncbi:hypothetical protein [Roseimicrobium sp. ORNL1]|uniref:LIC_10190 family membrane protein n=1 Tax=Roseimicrobium sp. ORNL1 TaxID=2711231 RepID=UPI0013E144A4|nr:hypothetical protein [Roseimicrobium sp. ORNL1]QIF04283.1 hypothetical protein G5S37_23085 [Roseimicrobium sp. ORNL1]
MIRIALYLLLQVAVLLGWGCLVQRLFIRGTSRGMGPFMLVWLGWAGLVALLQILHLLLPIQGWMQALVIMTGLGGLWLGRRELVTTLHLLDAAPQGMRRLAGWSLLAILLALFTGYLVLGPDQRALSYDTELYHLGIVRWNNEYPTVPGVANLHLRLGVNSTFLLYASLWNTGPGEGRTAWIVAGFPAFLLCIHWLAVILLDRSRGWAWRSAYCLLTLPYAIRLLAHTEASLYFDKVALIGALVTGLWLLHLGWLWLGEGQRQPNEREGPSAPTPSDSGTGHLLVPLLSVLVLNFTFKQSLAFHAALAGLLAIGLGILQLRRQRIPMASGVRIVLGWGVLPSLLLAAYLINNAFLSGWLFFPAPVLRLPVQWAVPVADTQDLYLQIKSWARSIGRLDLGEASVGEWIEPWKKGFLRSQEYQLLAAALAALAILIWKGWTGSRFITRTGGVRWVLALGVVSLCNLAAWFFTAPDLRFADGLFWMFFGWMGTFLLAALLEQARTVQTVALGIGLVFFLTVSGNLFPRYSPGQLWSIPHARATATVPYPGPGDALAENRDPHIPTVLVPKDPSSDQVANAPLPSTPYRNDRLRIRTPGNLRDGFYMVEFLPTASKAPQDSGSKLESRESSPQ